MKIFLDTADRTLIKYWAPTGVIHGITTNPSNLSKEGSNTREVLTDICTLLPDGDISIEVTEQEPQAVYEQALEIANFAPNAVVKIPCTEPLLPIINKLYAKEIAINVTLVFSPLQALIVANMGVAYISPFIGRLEDSGADGIELIEQLVTLKQNYDFESEILAASVRSITHWQEAALAGADVVTLHPSLLTQAMYHPLTEQGLKKFDEDWRTLGKKKLFE